MEDTPEFNDLNGKYEYFWRHRVNIFLIAGFLVQINKKMKYL